MDEMPFLTIYTGGRYYESTDICDSPLHCITLIYDRVCTIVMHQSTKASVICIQESVFCKQAGAVSFY